MDQVLGLCTVMTNVSRGKTRLHKVYDLVSRREMQESQFSSAGASQ
jgi:hypothetical protein